MDASGLSRVDVEDVAVLGWAAAREHRDLRGRDPRCTPSSPSLARSTSPTATWSPTGVLLDFKSTTTIRVCKLSDFWQLCGYALADTDNELQITAAGISAPRWRTRVTWPLPELLEQLPGNPVDLPTLRPGPDVGGNCTPRPRPASGPVPVVLE